MISVAQALDKLFALVTPLETEQVPLTAAAGRVMAHSAVARRDQPPFAASAMDGYAIRSSDAVPGKVLKVIGESAAGHAFAGICAAGEAVRIFTGAPVPIGADHVVIQEDVARDADKITLGADMPKGDTPGANIRPAGGDFRIGDTIDAPRLLRPADIALLASMNLGTVAVTRKPVIAILATGDELVQPGEAPGPDQIIASNSYGLHALLQQLGAEPRLLPIARDTLASLDMALRLASGADMIITIGGASVGDHDLVGAAAAQAGLNRAFYKVAMRPGKPLMAGRMGHDGMAMIGLPGNPVSAMVCGHVFIAPLVRKMLGLGSAPAPRETALLAAPLAANAMREHYMRARRGPDGVTAFDRQDSSLLGVLAMADCLVVRPPGDGPRPAGSTVDIIPI